MEAEAKAIMLEEGLFNLRDVRAIVFMPPAPEPTKEDKIRMKEEADRQLSEWGFVDGETQAWLKAVGIDIMGGASNGETKSH